jgi:hypothetical protein
MGSGASRVVVGRVVCRLLTHVKRRIAGNDTQYRIVVFGLPHIDKLILDKAKALQADPRQKTT